MVALPYFDLLLDRMRAGDARAQVFSRFVHWGYWEAGAAISDDPADFARAMERLNAEVLAAADLRDGQALLDAGCGFGGTLAAINEARSRMTLIGVNVDPRQLRVAEASVRGRAGNSVRFIEADACALPLGDSTVDRALAVECIFHFPSRLRFLREAARVLKPGGLLALSDFVPAFAAAGGSWLGRRLEAQVAAGYGDMGTGFPDGDYSRMARAAGLEPLADRDVTRNTLPTYPALLRHLREAALGDRGRALARSTRVLQGLSRLRLLRYRILAFRKPT